MSAPQRKCFIRVSHMRDIVRGHMTHDVRNLKDAEWSSPLLDGFFNSCPLAVNFMLSRTLQDVESVVLDQFRPTTFTMLHVYMLHDPIPDDAFIRLTLAQAETIKALQDSLPAPEPNPTPLAPPIKVSRSKRQEELPAYCGTLTDPTSKNGFTSAS